MRQGKKCKTTSQAADKETMERNKETYLTSLTSSFILSYMTVDVFSTYDAKARFSELLRRVQQNRRVLITKHGKPIAEIIPYAQGDESLPERLARLEIEGQIEPAEDGKIEFEQIVRRKGALKRFLDDRD